MGKKFTTEDFIKKVKEIHGNKYDYSLVRYINTKTKIRIICPIHGEFWQKPIHHLHRKQGCNKCGIERRTNKRRRKDFIEKAKEIHDNKYDYSLVEYINNKTKIKIICPMHGEFLQIPKHHLAGHGCSRCGSSGNLYNNKTFIKKAKEIHNNKYDYSLIKYEGYKTMIKIICPIHGEFRQLAYVHLYGCGCPVCNESHGERKIRTFLKENNIDFEYQKGFVDLKYKRSLKYDFYLPEYNLLIEFDGEQHFNSNIHIWHEDIKIRDEIKNEYARKNNINLLRIPYWKDVEKIISQVL